MESARGSWEGDGRLYLRGARVSFLNLWTKVIFNHYYRTKVHFYVPILETANIALETLKQAHLTEIKSDQDPHNLARTFEESREVHVGRVQPLDDDGDGETRRGRASDLYNV